MPKVKLGRNSTLERQEATKKVIRRAMETHGLSERGLAQRIGCGWGSVAHILSEEDVRMTQTQWFNLMTLGGAFRNARPNV